MAVQESVVPSAIICSSRASWLLQPPLPLSLPNRQIQLLLDHGRSVWQGGPFRQSGKARLQGPHARLVPHNARRGPARPEERLDEPAAATRRCGECGARVCGRGGAERGDARSCRGEDQGGAFPPSFSPDPRSWRDPGFAADAYERTQSSGRGAPNGGGKLSAQLASQSRDGGRKEEARLEAERRGEQLVVRLQLTRCRRRH